MKQAQGTIMSDEQIMEVARIGYFNLTEYQRIAKAQDEISFQEGEKQGIKKVVEWLENHDYILTMYYGEWQSKLKEWEYNSKPIDALPRAS